jgi:hypothetical protein
MKLFIKRKKITNGTIGVTFAKVVIFEKGGEDVCMQLKCKAWEQKGTRTRAM